METIEYVAEVLPDGHLSLPENIVRRLKLKTHSKLRIQIQPEKTNNQSLSQFCGQWQDDDVKAIVNDIYKSRNKNSRSDNLKL